MYAREECGATEDSPLCVGDEERAAEGAVKDAEASANQRGAESQRCGCFLEVERGQCGRGSEGRARGSLTEMMGRH